MAQLNFPDATADGQIYNGTNGVVYTYVGNPPNGYWSGTFQNDALDTLNELYVEKAGDNMTGDLTLNTDKITLNAGNGSATFKGVVTANTSASTLSDYAGSFVNNKNALKWQSTIVARNTAVGGPVWAGLANNFNVSDAGVTSQILENGSAYFAGNVTAPNVTFNLGADDDANYTTTTETYTEEETYTGPLGNTLTRDVTKTRDIRTYTGPTLDVKDRLQNLISRIDSIEANEVADDATDSALLQLVASLTQRLDEKDAAIASLTSSLSALTSRVTTLES